MAVVFRWLMRIATLLVVLAVIGVGGAYWLASRSLPDYDDTVRVPNLEAEVEIVRELIQQGVTAVNRSAPAALHALHALNAH